MQIDIGTMTTSGCLHQPAEMKSFPVTVTTRLRRHSVSGCATGSGTLAAVRRRSNANYEEHCEDSAAASLSSNRQR